MEPVVPHRTRELKLSQQQKIEYNAKNDARIWNLRT